MYNNVRQKILPYDRIFVAPKSFTCKTFFLIRSIAYENLRLTANNHNTSQQHSNNYDFLIRTLSHLKIRMWESSISTFRCLLTVSHHSPGSNSGADEKVASDLGLGAGSCRALQIAQTLTPDESRHRPNLIEKTKIIEISIFRIAELRTNIECELFRKLAFDLKFGGFPHYHIICITSNSCEFM